MGSGMSHFEVLQRSCIYRFLNTKGQINTPVQLLAGCGVGISIALRALLPTCEFEAIAIPTLPTLLYPTLQIRLRPCIIILGTTKLAKKRQIISDISEQRWPRSIASFAGTRILGSRSIRLSERDPLPY